MSPDYLLKRSDGILEIVTGEEPFLVNPSAGIGSYEVFRLNNGAHVELLASNQILPKLSGLQRAGAALSVDASSLSEPLAYQWKADGHDIIGEIGETYTPHMHMQQISCVVTGTEGAFETPALKIYHTHAMTSHNTSDDAILRLIPHTDVSHIAVQDGAWSDPTTWDAGTVPDMGAIVLVPHGMRVTYDVVLSPRLDRLRIDGKLTWALDRSTDLLVETIVVTQSGEIEIGTSDNRLNLPHHAEIRFSDRAYKINAEAPTVLDMESDPELLSRGLLFHGQISIWAHEFSSWDRSAVVPMAGDTSITLSTPPTGWHVGDTIIVAGTNSLVTDGVPADENEERMITGIAGSVVSFADALVYDHDHKNAQISAPDLTPGVALKDRNITFRSETAHEDMPWLRAHMMGVHGTAIADIWGAAFLDMGRTDKSRPAGIMRNGEFTYVNWPTSSSQSTTIITPDINLQSRYPIHLHFVGYGRGPEKSVISGCFVQDAPAWGYVHHGCEADFMDNVGYRYVGAGMVSETADELGAWVGNFMFGCRRGFLGDVANAGNPKNTEGSTSSAGDFGRIGMGMFFRGRAMRVNRNLVMSAPHGYVFFHRANTNENTQISFRRSIPRDHVDVKYLSALNWNNGFLSSLDYPIRHFADNEAGGVARGFSVTKSGAKQNHDLSINVKRLKVWACTVGGFTEYIGTYNFIDCEFYAAGGSTVQPGYVTTGLQHAPPSEQISSIRTKTRGFKYGLLLQKGDGPTIPSDYDAVDDPVYTISEHDSIGDDVPRKFETLEATLEVDNTRTEDVSKIYPIGSPPTEIEPILKDGDGVSEPAFIAYEWSGSLSGGALSNKQTYVKIDSVGTQPIPKIWDPVGFYKGNFNHDSDGLTQSDAQTGFVLYKYAQQFGYWTYNGDNILLIPNYFSDRISGRAILHTFAVKCNGNMSSYTNNGAFILSAVAPVRADIIVPTPANTPIDIDVLNDASGEAGASLFLFEDNLKPDNGEISVENGVITYTPDRNYTGTDEITAFISDGRGRYKTVQISVAIAQ